MFNLNLLHEHIGLPPSAAIDVFPYKDVNNESWQNRGSGRIPAHPSSLPNAHPSSLRPPNFEQLMLLHHAQQQHRMLQQNTLHPEAPRWAFHLK